jgi:hypothetical protein
MSSRHRLWTKSIRWFWRWYQRIYGRTNILNLVGDQRTANTRWDNGSCVRAMISLDLFCRRLKWTLDCNTTHREVSVYIPDCRRNLSWQWHWLQPQRNSVSSRTCSHRVRKKVSNGDSLLYLFFLHAVFFLYFMLLFSYIFVPLLSFLIFPPPQSIWRRNMRRNIANR